MIKSRRRNYQLGGSKAVTYPSDVIVGEEASVVGNRLLLIDPRGEIPVDDLMEFMEKHVEPEFWKWWKQKEGMRRMREKGAMKVLQAKALAEVQEAESVEMQAIAAGPQIYLVNCWRCGGQIAWRMDLGMRGCCPYCGALIQLMV